MLKYILVLSKYGILEVGKVRMVKMGKSDTCVLQPLLFKIFDDSKDFA